MTIATPISKWPGKFGTCVVWDCGGRYVTTSSADHEVDDLLWVVRSLNGRLNDDGSEHVRETVAFLAEDERGGFRGDSELAVVKSAESHLEAIQAAGYTPTPIPSDLPVSEVPW